MPMVAPVLEGMIKAKLMATPIAIAPQATVATVTQPDGTSGATVAAVPTPIHMDAKMAGVIAKAVAESVIEHITMAGLAAFPSGKIT